MFTVFRTAVAAATLVVAGVSASAQTPPAASNADTMNKLEDFKSTGAKPLVPIPQDPQKTADLEKMLSHIKLPPGFKISVYAQVPDARMIAVGPQGVVVFVSTRKDKVYALTDRGRTGHATEVKEFAPGVGFTNPNGVCFSRDGMLYVAEQNRVLQFPAAEFFYENADVAVTPIVKQGDLIPASEQSFNHSARACRMGPDKKLYITLGQPYNVFAKSKLDMYHKVGMDGIVRMNQNGSDREVYALGVRNSVGLDFNPKDHTLWFTDNQVDGMGDDIPPGELNHATRMGENFGYPWYGGGHTRTVEWKDEPVPAGVVFPVVEEVAHAADLGMSFYTGHMFPEKYRGAIFSAQHGSWNRTDPAGARVLVTFVNGNAAPGGSKPFAEGWLNSDGGYDGRPVDVEQMRDGSLLVSDDLNGAVYRITYTGAK